MTIDSSAVIGTHEQAKESGTRMIIAAASLGTMFEFYDFFLYGALAVFFSNLFFPPGNETAGFLASLATFGAGFFVRPFGALLFGRVGDLVGRKYSFLVTILIMGASTIAVGLVPTYAQIGIWAPILLVSLRLLQGLALGGEYGGAAVYIAEHSARNSRGIDTSWVQTTGTMGFLLSLIVIIACRQSMSPAEFAIWGWRIPFLLSAILLAISVYIRMKLSESPVFMKMKSSGKLSARPVAECFGSNLKVMLLAIFGAIAGQGVVWYTGHFYALYFLTTALRVDYLTAYMLMLIAVGSAAPLYLLCGWLSDRIGRKPIIMAGCALAAATYFPLFQVLTSAVNPALVAAMNRAPVHIAGSNCHFNIFAKPSSPCDLAKEYFTKAGIGYTTGPAIGSAEVTTKIGDDTIGGFDPAAYAKAVNAAGYPKAADPQAINWSVTLLVLFVSMTYVAMVFGPLSAFLVELFPSRIRYTGFSFPYLLRSSSIAETSTLDFGIPLLLQHSPSRSERSLCLKQKTWTSKIDGPAPESRNRPHRRFQELARPGGTKLLR